jgi:hypothetical protein
MRLRGGLLPVATERPTRIDPIHRVAEAIAVAVGANAGLHLPPVGLQVHAQLGGIVAGASVLQACVRVKTLTDIAFGVRCGGGDGETVARHRAVGQVEFLLIRPTRRVGDLPHRPLRIAVQIAGVGGQHAVKEFHRRMRIG